MIHILAFLAVGLMFAVFALLHRRVEPRTCTKGSPDDCENCSLESECPEQDHARV